MNYGKYPQESKKGYTLIELIVVVVIMILVFSLSTANFRDFQSRRLMDNAANQVKSDLRLVQQRAKSGTKPQPPTYTCGTLLGHEFKSPDPDSTGNSYYLTPVCAGPVDCKDASLSGTCTIRLLDSNITISTNDIRFNVLGRGAFLEDSALVDSTTITLTHTNGATRQITIDKGGNIE